MTKVKKIVTIAVCLAVAAGGGTGGTLLYRSRQAKKHEVDVMPVANMVQYYWGDDLSMDGQVVSGDVQNVTPSNDQLVEKVLVKEGDHVTKGTPLLQYDMTAVGLEVAQKQTALAVAQDNVRQAKKELERIQKLKPSEELTETILDAVSKQKLWPKWQKDGGQYIPNPATWLNQGRWEDEPPEGGEDPFAKFT